MIPLVVSLIGVSFVLGLVLTALVRRLGKRLGDLDSAGSAGHEKQLRAVPNNGGIAICAPIAPYASTRRQVRDAVEAVGGFIEIHVATPLDVCEERDRKGLYAKARAGIIQSFTGISDPYEEPTDAELVIDSGELSPEAAAQEVLRYLEKEGYVG